MVFSNSPCSQLSNEPHIDWVALILKKSRVSPRKLGSYSNPRGETWKFSKWTETSQYGAHLKALSVLSSKIFYSSQILTRAPLNYSNSPGDFVARPKKFQNQRKLADMGGLFESSQQPKSEKPNKKFPAIEYASKAVDLCSKEGQLSFLKARCQLLHAIAYG